MGLGRLCCANVSREACNEKKILAFTESEKYTTILTAVQVFCPDSSHGNIRLSWPPLADLIFFHQNFLPPHRLKKKNDSIEIF